MNRVKIIDPELRETNYVYDERNLLFTVTDARNALTQYDYDLNGNLSKIKDANTNTTQYFYDDFDRLKETKYPNLVLEFYTYDAASNLKTKTNGAGEVTRYNHDELNRLKLKEYLGCSVNICGGDVTYSYDQASRMLQAASSIATINYQYDNLNRITKETTQLSNGSAYSVHSKYDKSGNRTNLTYPNGTKFSYGYDSMNRLTQINRGFKLTLATGPVLDVSKISRHPERSEGSAVLDSSASPQNDAVSGFEPLSGRQLFKFTYDPLSRRTNLERVPTDLHTKYTYDTLNRLTSITSSQPEVLGDILYPLYDKLGNRKEEDNKLIPNKNFHFTYGYNNRYELTDVSDQLPVVRYQYQYDLTGNRQLATENGVPSTYVPNNLNQYSSVSGQTYTYDAKGNLTNDGANTYTYDYENRLISVNGTTEYKYDPLGRRIIRITGTNASLSIYDQNHILETYNCDPTLQTCTLTHSYLYSNQIDESLLLTRYETPGIGKDYYYHQDALGNVIALTDTQNEVVEYVQYDPYGNPRFFNQDGESIPNSSIGNPKLFTGKALDPETGLYHFEARTYSPRIGRFLQRDPYTWAPNDPRILTNSSFRFQRKLIENIGGSLPALQLPYLYTLNNPTNLTDPSGKNVVANVVVAIGAALLIYKFVSSFKKLYKKASISGENIQGRDRALQCGDIDAAEEYQSKFQQSYTETARAAFDFGVSAPGTSLSGPPPTSRIDLLAELVKFIIENIFSNS